MRDLVALDIEVFDWMRSSCSKEESLVGKLIHEREGHGEVARVSAFDFNEHKWPIAFQRRLRTLQDAQFMALDVALNQAEPALERKFDIVEGGELHVDIHVLCRAVYTGRCECRERRYAVAGDDRDSEEPRAGTRR
jgi:hypothetical protein